MGPDLNVDWRTLACSMPGTGHIEDGRPCADACAARELPLEHGTLLVAVASDGAGTAEAAHEGARVACEALLDVAEGWAASHADLDGACDDTVRGWIDHVHDRVEAVAALAGREPRDYAATLVAALVDGRSALFLQVGDGAIVYRDACGVYRPALWPQCGEYANTTWFVTDPLAGEIAQVARTSRVDELALFTDGVQRLALCFGSRAAHGPFFEPMFRRLRAARVGEAASLAGQLRAFLSSDSVNARTDDDKTLVLATRVVPAS